MRTRPSHSRHRTFPLEGREFRSALSFGHPRTTLAFWRGLAAAALKHTPTPFYLFAPEPAEIPLARLRELTSGMGIPVRHWLSFKTQPLRPWLQWWKARSGMVEVVSEFELRAALAEGYRPSQVLVNGPAKHHWLVRHTLGGLRVNLDSLAELPILMPLAKRLRWTLGIRIRTREECDSESPGLPTQFGMEPTEAAVALRALKKRGLEAQIAHFHLRTNVPSAGCYERAVSEIARACRDLDWSPKFLDCGGGLPPPHVLTRDGERVDAGFDFEAWKRGFEGIRKGMPFLEELWLENGRFVAAGSGILAVRVLDLKDRSGMRFLICDGGRTTNALISTWESHALLTVPSRRGNPVPTTVCGPTCMAFDQLARRLLPSTIRPGDVLLWMDAGAYHLPWETRFSHGHAAVLWGAGGKLRQVRPAQSFHDWWGRG